MFTIFILQQYNYLFKDVLIYDCQCYEKYKINFIKHVIVEKQNYFACIYDRNKNIVHKSLPILLGSKVDLIIRGNSTNPFHYGAIIVEGEFKLIPNYITNNVNNLVVYKASLSKNVQRKSLMWHIRHKNSVYLLKYQKSNNSTKMFVTLSKIVEDVLKNTKSTKFASCQKSQVEINWLNWLNSVNPFGYQATADEYLSLFDYILQHYPNIDDMTNKVLITCPTILKKVYDMTSDSKRLKAIFVTGNMGFVLSKKNPIETPSKNVSMSVQKDYSSIWIPIDGQKHDKIHSVVSTTKKIIVNQQLNNSKALKYSSDAESFICPFSVKEMKDAGVTLALAQYTIVSKFVQLETIMEYFNGFGSKQGMYRLVVNGFITNFKINFNIDDFVKYKQALVYVSFFVYGTFLYLISIDNIILKWSSKYKIFVSPKEVTYFPDVFDNYDVLHKFNNLISNLPRSFLNTQPTKNVTALNNLKGACNNIKDEDSLIMFKQSIGYNSALIHNNDNNDFTYLAHLSKSEFTPSEYMKHHNNPILPEVKNKKCTPQCVNELFDPNYALTNKLTLEIFDKTMPLTTGTLPVSNTIKSQKKRCIKRKYQSSADENSGVDEPVLKKAQHQICNTDYLRLIGDVLTKMKSETYQMKLYMAFALAGPTVEDGFILDKSVAEHGPTKIISVSLAIKLKKDFSVLSKRTVDLNKIEYTKANVLANDKIIFGTISSLAKLSLPLNKKITIEQFKIRDVYYYKIIYDLQAINKFVNLNIESNFNKNTTSVFVHFDYSIKLGIGTKICTLSGRKGVISAVEDLSKYAGYDSYGNFIKPQIIMSPIVPISNAASGLVMDMFQNKNRAFSKEGGVISEVDFVVHYIEPSTKLSNTTVRNDAMTNQNGFDANCLAVASSVLTKQKSTTSAEERMAFLSNLYMGKGLRFQFFDEYSKPFQQEIVIDSEKN